MWATAPYLHNNALGTYIKDPSVRGRVLAFQDATEKLLWPERRLGVQSIAVTSIDSELRIPNRTRPLKVPAGTPVDLIARVDPREVPAIAQNRRRAQHRLGRSAFPRVDPHEIRRPISCSIAATCSAPSCPTKTSARSSSS